MMSQDTEVVPQEESKMISTTDYNQSITATITD